MDSINILMLGGKRCGKTTVLASMCNEAEKVLSGTGMNLNVSQQTKLDLERAQSAIAQKLDVFKNPLMRVEVDDNPTSAMKAYSFQLRLQDSGKGIPFQIYDIPGEWLSDTHQDQIKSLIHQCQVIIIAIDTPYLFAKMTDEGYGKYHGEYNKPTQIANFFKNSLTVNDIMDRMILFVPIKCERYYHLTHTPQLNAFNRDYMQELVDAVSNGYRELLQYLRSGRDLMNSCTIAITPILSAGGIDFVCFRNDPETGKMVSLYQEAEFLPQYERGYHPKFCEQPIAFALTYILKQALTNLDNNNSIYQFKSNLQSGFSYAQLAQATECLRKRLKRNTGIYAEDGYYIIQNPKGI